MKFSVFYLTQYIQNITLACNQCKPYILFSHMKSSDCHVFYMYSISPYGLVTFLRLDSYVWLVATVLGSTVLSGLHFF